MKWELTNLELKAMVIKKLTGLEGSMDELTEEFNKQKGKKEPVRDTRGNQHLTRGSRRAN